MKLKDIQDPKVLAKALVYASENSTIPQTSSRLLRKDLIRAFIWGDTEEGLNYWADLKIQYEEEKQRKQWFMETFCS